MNRSDFLSLLAYSDNCWSLLRDTLAAHPETFDIPYETTSSWNTVRLLLAHSIGAEERWITFRLQGRAAPVPYPERAAATFDAIYADFQAIRAATYAYLGSLTESALAESAGLAASGFRADLTRADVLFQILNHENYHRGQVIMALQRLGLDPPNFDYILLKESAGNNGE